MATPKERHQNPVLGDDLRLRLMSYSSNLPADLASIDRVEIIRFDPELCSADCPDGGVIVETIPGEQVVRDSEGKYSVTIHPESPGYVIGKYADVWYVVTRNGQQPGKKSQKFEIFPDLWYFSNLPAVYSFDFAFQPNRIRKGSNKYLVIRITPNVPRSTDLENYYLNLAVTANLYISIEKTCDPCRPDCEEDLRLLVDRELVDLREKVFGYYMLDTREMDCGLYNVWFELEFGGITEVSAKNQMQIF